MLTIGFATEFYTLWDVTIDNSMDEYGMESIKTYYHYIKNISTDLEKTKQRISELENEMQMRFR